MFKKNKKNGILDKNSRRISKKEKTIEKENVFYELKYLQPWTVSSKQQWIHVCLDAGPKRHSQLQCGQSSSSDSSQYISAIPQPGGEGGDREKRTVAEEIPTKKEILHNRHDPLLRLRLSVRSLCLSDLFVSKASMLRYTTLLSSTKTWSEMLAAIENQQRAELLALWYRTESHYCSELEKIPTWKNEPSIHWIDLQWKYASPNIYHEVAPIICDFYRRQCHTDVLIKLLK